MSFVSVSKTGKRFFLAVVFLTPTAALAPWTTLPRLPLERPREGLGLEATSGCQSVSESGCFGSSDSVWGLVASLQISRLQIWS